MCELFPIFDGFAVVFLGFPSPAAPIRRWVPRSAPAVCWEQPFLAAGPALRAFGEHNTVKEDRALNLKNIHGYITTHIHIYTHLIFLLSEVAKLSFCWHLSPVSLKAQIKFQKPRAPPVPRQYTIQASNGVKRENAGYWRQPPTP